MNCGFCGKSFNRGFNLRRHENEYCPLRNVSEDDTPEPKIDHIKRKHTESDDDQLSSSGDDHTSDGSEHSETDYDTDSSETEDETDPWVSLIVEAQERHLTEYNEVMQDLTNSGLDIRTAEIKAQSIILPKIEKELENIYLKRLKWIRNLKKNPVHKKIMHTRDKFLEDEGFDPDEALQASVEKRKFLLKQLLDNYQLYTDDTESNQDDH